MFYSLRNIAIGYIAVLAVVLLIVFIAYSTLGLQEKEHIRIANARTSLQRLQPASQNMRETRFAYFSNQAVFQQRLPSLVNRLKQDSANISKLAFEDALRKQELTDLIGQAIAVVASPNHSTAQNDSIEAITGRFAATAAILENENRQMLNEAYGNSLAYNRSTFTYIRIISVVLILLLLGSSYFMYKDIRSSKKTTSELKQFNEQLEKRVNEQTAQLIKEKNLSDTIINSLPGIFYLRDLQGKLLRWNKEFENITGFNKDEITHINTLDFFSDDEKPLIQSTIDKVISEGSATVEATAIVKGNKKVPFYIVAQLIHYEGMPCIIGCGIDITERKKIEQENDRVKRLLNERIKELTTLYRISEILQIEDKPLPVLLQNIVEFLPTGWQHSEVTAASILLGDKEYKTPNYTSGPHKQEASFRMPDDTMGTVEIVYLEERPLEDDNAFFKEERHLIELVAEMIRVSISRRQETEALKKSEANLHTILDTTDTIYVLFDNNFRIISYNQRAAQFSENQLRHPIEALRENFMDHFSHEQQPSLHEWLKQASPHDHVSYEITFERPNHSVQWYNVRMFPITGSGKSIFGLMLAVSDITETKKLEHDILIGQVEEQKKITRAVLKAQESERNKIAQELHDNVNQILASTKLYLSMAIADFPNNLDFLKKSGDYIDNAIGEIRKLSSKEVTPLKEINLQELIRSLLESLSHNAGIATHFDYNLDIALDEDLKLNIYRIVQEQVNNMLKHSHANHAAVALNNSNGYLKLQISDNGVGFNPQEKRKGIGLANIINRVESYNGEIRINSSPGKGVLTDIRFPTHFR